MNRREFVRLAGSGLSAAAMAEAVVEAQVAQAPTSARATVGKRPAARPAPQKALMKVGTQHGDTEDILSACAAFGVNNICSSLPSAKMDDTWSVDGLSRLRDRVAAHGISLDMVPLPMSSSEISSAEMPAIYLGQSPERDRNIDDICQMIRNCARAGIMQVKYNFTIIGIPRSGTAPGRGRSRYSEFIYANAKQDPAADDCRQGRRRYLLGAHHLLPRTRRAGRRGIQGEDGMPSARSGRAKRNRLARRRCGARFARGTEAVRRRSRRARITA